MFHLHPDFNPRIVSLSEGPFEVVRTGWGVFDVGVEVHFRNGGSKMFTHPLVLDDQQKAFLQPLD